jgi:hypothetical protein
MGIGDSFPGVKLAEHESEYSSPSSAQSSSIQVYMSTPHTYVLMAWGYIDLLPLLITTCFVFGKSAVRNPKWLTEILFLIQII